MEKHSEWNIKGKGSKNKSAKENRQLFGSAREKERKGTGAGLKTIDGDRENMVTKEGDWENRGTKCVVENASVVFERSSRRQGSPALTR
jgi:hypothetical protein